MSESDSGGEYVVVPMKGFLDAHKPCLYFIRSGGKFKLWQVLPPIKLYPCCGKVKISLPHGLNAEDFEPPDVIRDKLEQFKLLDFLWKLEKGMLLDVIWDRRALLHGAVVSPLRNPERPRPPKSPCFPFYRPDPEGHSITIEAEKESPLGTVLIFTVSDLQEGKPSAKVKKLVCSVDPEIQPHT